MPNFTKLSEYLYVGLSTDTKPTGVELRTKCYETDTTNLFVTRDGTNWVQVAVNIAGGIPYIADYVQDADVAVPAQNSANNVNIRDVVGNKTDTVAGNSIIALLKAIKAKTDTL